MRVHLFDVVALPFGAARRFATDACSIRTGSWRQAPSSGSPRRAKGAGDVLRRHRPGFQGNRLARGDPRHRRSGVEDATAGAVRTAVGRADGVDGRRRGGPRVAAPGRVMAGSRAYHPDAAGLSGWRLVAAGPARHQPGHTRAVDGGCDQPTRTWRTRVRHRAGGGHR